MAPVRRGGLQGARDGFTVVTATAVRTTPAAQPALGAASDESHSWYSPSVSPSLGLGIARTARSGIGANTAIFSVVRGVLLRDLPYVEPERLIRVFSVREGGLNTVSPADFNDWRRQSSAFAGLAASDESTVNLTGSGTAYTQARVSANMFQLLGVHVQLGRAFVSGEDVPDAPRVAILSDGLWRARFGADPNIIGKSITLDGYATQVVGVAPSELAVRTALGAGRGRLVRQLMTESCVLALAGGAAGLALALWGTKLLLSLAPSDLPRLYDVRVDAPVLLFTLGATVIAALFFGCIPALQASASRTALQLRTGDRGSRGRPGSTRARSALVVAEITLALMLLVGAGLLMKSFSRLRQVDVGFDTSRLSTFTVSLSPVKYATVDQQRAFAHTLLDNVHRLPGVDSAAVTFGLPLSGASFRLSFDVAGRPAPPPNAEPVAQVRIVSPGYFATVGIPLIRGRAFDANDGAGKPGAMIMSQEAARRYFANEDPIGKRLTFGWTRDGQRLSGEIVGVVGDVRQHGLTTGPTPHAYAVWDQWPIDELTVVMRTRGIHRLH